MSYSVREVAAMLGLPPAQIRAWAREGLIEPQRGRRGELRLGFHDLILLRTAEELASANVPQRRIKRALTTLKKRLPEDRSLTALRISAQGEQVVVREGEALWDPESGQSLFDFSVADVAAVAAPVAKANFERAKARESDDAEAWFELGCDLEIAAPDEAVAAYRKTIELQPQHADAHVNLGRLFHESGDARSAEMHYRAALAADPAHSLAAYNLGVALEDLGRIAEAVEVYGHALELDPGNADAHYNLAGIYERGGDRRTAFQHLKEYSRLRA